jgi:hypothetical protein
MSMRLLRLVRARLFPDLIGELMQDFERGDITLNAARGRIGLVPLPPEDGLVCPVCGNIAGTGHKPGYECAKAGAEA